MLITSADLAELRRLEREWVTATGGDHSACRLAFQSLLLAYAPDLLDAAEALLTIRSIARTESDLGDYAKRIDAVLAGPERKS
ncbi:MAG TPA: hypothetical protein VJ801_13225 [Polyangia bacterium]|jgi:hypothetical protein|nr:hypothetical protein [Polyangia bacterium]